MAVPIVGQPRFHLEPLAGEALVERRGAADATYLAEGQIARLPDDIATLVGHHDRPLELVGQHVIEYRRRAGVGDHRQRPAFDPDVFGDQRAGRIVFGDHIAVEVVHHMQGGRGRDGARHQPRQIIVDVAACRRTVHGGRRKLAGGIVAVGLCQRRRDGRVLRDVAGEIRLEAAARCAAGENAGQPVGAGLQAVGIDRGDAADGDRALGDVADAVDRIGQASPRPVGILDEAVGGIGVGLIVGGVELILDCREIALVLVLQRMRSWPAAQAFRCSGRRRPPAPRR